MAQRVDDAPAAGTADRGTDEQAEGARQGAANAVEEYDAAAAKAGLPRLDARERQLAELYPDAFTKAAEAALLQAAAGPGPDGAFEKAVSQMRRGFAACAAQAARERGWAVNADLLTDIISERDVYDMLKYRPGDLKTVVEEYVFEITFDIKAAMQDDSIVCRVLDPTKPALLDSARYVPKQALVTAALQPCPDSPNGYAYAVRSFGLGRRGRFSERPDIERVIWDAGAKGREAEGGNPAEQAVNAFVERCMPPTGPIDTAIVLEVDEQLAIDLTVAPTDGLLEGLDDIDQPGAPVATADAGTVRTYRASRPIRAGDVKTYRHVCAAARKVGWQAAYGWNMAGRQAPDRAAERAAREADRLEWKEAASHGAR